MAKPRKTKQIKVKKKRWFSIICPKSLGEKFIGETYLGEASEAVGRTITTNLMQVTGDIKSQSSSITFVISGVKDNKLTTDFVGYQFSPSSIKRFVRRRMTRVDDSIMLSTKENVKVRIKPILLTRSKVSKSVEYSLRKQLKEELTRIVKQTPFEELIHNILKHRIQKDLKDKLSKVYPVRTLEIRVLKKLGVSEKPIKVEEKKQPKEEVKEETKEVVKEEKGTVEEKKPEVKKEEKKPEVKKEEKTKVKEEKKETPKKKAVKKTETKKKEEKPKKTAKKAVKKAKK